MSARDWNWKKHVERMGRRQARDETRREAQATVDEMADRLNLPRVVASGDPDALARIEAALGEVQTGIARLLAPASEAARSQNHALVAENAELVRQVALVAALATDHAAAMDELLREKVEEVLALVDEFGKPEGESVMPWLRCALAERQHAAAEARELGERIARLKDEAETAWSDVKANREQAERWRSTALELIAAKEAAEKGAREQVEGDTDIIQALKGERDAALRECETRREAALTDRASLDRLHADLDEARNGRASAMAVIDAYRKGLVEQPAPEDPPHSTAIQRGDVAPAPQPGNLHLELGDEALRWLEDEGSRRNRTPEKFAAQLIANAMKAR